MQLPRYRLAPSRMNPRAMKSLNAISVLNLVRQHGRVSRASLAKLTKLSKPTVSELVSFLLGRNLLIETGEGESTTRGGKKPTFLEFHAAVGTVAAVDVSPERVRFALCDLSGTILREDDLLTDGQLNAASITALIRKGLKRMLRHKPGETQAIGIAVPGIVDCGRGVILETDSVFGWRNVTLGAELEAEFTVPVYLDNDVNLAALAELNAGWGRSRQDFVLIRWGTGIGAGIVIGGKLYHGAHWAAGEIGHMLLNIASQPQIPDPRGYLESVVGTDRIASRLEQRRFGKGRPRSASAESDVLSSLKALAREGDSRASSVLEDIVRHIASAIANLSAAYDPEVIVLLGQPFLALIDQVQRDAAKLVPWALEIRPSQIGDRASLQGAIIAALDTAYETISRSFHWDNSEYLTDHSQDHRTAEANG